MNKRDTMMRKIEAEAAATGHRLHPWSKGRWGFSTTCYGCGGHVAITVSRNAQREGEWVAEDCAARADRIAKHSTDAKS